MSDKDKVKRSLFAELKQGIEEMAQRRENKITLRTRTVAAPAVEESPGAEFFLAAREKFNVSRAVWAEMLRVSPRTVEKWEQSGQSSPLAATFVDLVLRYPDTLDKLQSLPRRVARNPKLRSKYSKAQGAKPSEAKRIAGVKRNARTSAISA